MWASTKIFFDPVGIYIISLSSLCFLNQACFFISIKLILSFGFYLSSLLTKSLASADTGLVFENLIFPVSIKLKSYF